MAELQDDFQIPAGAGMPKGPAAKRQPTPSLTKEPTPVEDDSSEDKKEPKPKPKYAPEELLKIFDDIIFLGEYTEDVVIKGKLNAGFRTRSGGEIEEINRVVDNSKANLLTTLNDTRTLLNLQYGLTRYHTQDLRSMKPEDKAKFIKTIPGPVIAALLTALQSFDEKVFLACQEGEENF